MDNPTLIYVSTDPEEAHALIHDYHDSFNPGGGDSCNHTLKNGRGGHHDYTWQHLHLNRAEELKETFGFAPQCCIGISQPINSQQRDEITKAFTKKGLAVAVKQNGHATVYRPQNDDIVRMLLSRYCTARNWYEAARFFNVAVKIGNPSLEKQITQEECCLNATT